MGDVKVLLLKKYLISLKTFINICMYVQYVEAKMTSPIYCRGGHFRFNILYAYTVSELEVTNYKRLEMIEKQNNF